MFLTVSRLICAIKHAMAQSVLSWVTVREYWVL
jgi:hypothetical protein